MDPALGPCLEPSPKENQPNIQAVVFLQPPTILVRSARPRPSRQCTISDSSQPSSQPPSGSPSPTSRPAFHHPAAHKLPGRVVELDKVLVQRRNEFQALLRHLIQIHSGLAAFGTLVMIIFAILRISYCGVVSVVWQWIFLGFICCARGKYGGHTHRHVQLPGKVTSGDLRLLKLFNRMGTIAFVLGVATFLDGLFTISKVLSPHQTVNFLDTNSTRCGAWYSCDTFYIRAEGTGSSEASAGSSDVFSSLSNLGSLNWLTDAFMIKFTVAFGVAKMLYGVLVIMASVVFSKQITDFFRRRELAVALSQLRYDYSRYS